MKLTYSHQIDGEPVFTGEINDQKFSVLFKATDIDYGWSPLDYLPGQDAGVAHEYWDDILEYLSDNQATLLDMVR